MRRVRESPEITDKAGLTVDHADLVRRGQPVAVGVTREIRAQGVNAVCTRPVEVGSVFLLSFDVANIDLPPAFAVCDR